jgi:hypothetical protein
VTIEVLGLPLQRLPAALSELHDVAQVLGALLPEVVVVVVASISHERWSQWDLYRC